MAPPKSLFNKVIDWWLATSIKIDSSTDVFCEIKEIFKSRKILLSDKNILAMVSIIQMIERRSPNKYYFVCYYSVCQQIIFQTFKLTTCGKAYESMLNILKACETKRYIGSMDNLLALWCWTYLNISRASGNILKTREAKAVYNWPLF